jgi:hypothetical protein
MTDEELSSLFSSLTVEREETNYRYDGGRSSSAV